MGPTASCGSRCRSSRPSRSIRLCSSSIVILSLIGIIYGGLVAMVQPDFKKLIAYHPSPTWGS